MARRAPDGADGRAVRLFLTEDGWAAREVAKERAAVTDAWLPFASPWRNWTQWRVGEHGCRSFQDPDVDNQRRRSVGSLCPEG